MTRTDDSSVWTSRPTGFEAVHRFISLEGVPSVRGDALDAALRAFENFYGHFRQRPRPCEPLGVLDRNVPDVCLPFQLGQKISHSIATFARKKPRFSYRLLKL